MLIAADFSYVRLVTGVFVYTAFVIDAFAGRIVGWECSASKHDRFVRSAIRLCALSFPTAGSRLCPAPQRVQAVRVAGSAITEENFLVLLCD
jgi:hypothetical protein